MGKRTRRGHRHQRRGGGGGSGGGKGNGTSNALTKSAATPPPDPPLATTVPAVPALLKKLRHGDKNVRHAALTSLLCTQLDPDRLITTGTGKAATTKLSSINGCLRRDVLQAVQELVMDTDPPTAIAATTCLAHIAAYGMFDGSTTSASAYNSNKHTKQLHSTDLQETAAGWIVILLGRLEQLLNQAASVGFIISYPADRAATQSTCTSIPATSLVLSSSSSSNKDTKKTRQQRQHQQWWLELNEQCLRCLTHLLENNADATLRRLLFQAPNAELAHQWVRVTIQLLHWSWQQQQQQQFIASAASRGPSVPADSDGTTSTTSLLLWSSILMWSCRLLHTACEDNPQFVQLCLEHQQVQNEYTFESILSKVVTTPPASYLSQDLPAELFSCIRSNVVCASLHAAGTWMCLFREDTGATDLPCLAACCARIGATLHDAQIDFLQCLQSPASVADWIASYQAYQAQQADDELETSVLQKQANSKEPARQIARRLQQQQQQQQNGLVKLEDVGSKCKVASPSPPIKDDETMDMENNIPMTGNLSTATATTTTMTNTLEPMDVTARWNAVQRSWQDQMQPIQLALEILSDWTSPDDLTTTSTNRGQILDDGNEEDDVRMTDAVSSPTRRCHNLALVNILMEQNVLKIIHVLFQSLFGSSLVNLWKRPKRPEYSTLHDDATIVVVVDDAITLPEVLVDSLSELQSKVAICYSHLILATVLTSTVPQQQQQKQQQNFPLERLLNCTPDWQQAMQNALDVSAAKAVLAALLVAIKSTLTTVSPTTAANAAMASLIQGTWFNTTNPNNQGSLVSWLTSLLLQVSPSTTATTSKSPATMYVVTSMMKRDVICMLGMIQQWVGANNNNGDDDGDDGSATAPVAMIQMIGTITQTMVQVLEMQLMSNDRDPINNTAVCVSVSVSAATTTATLVAEILNVFMDVYGAVDDGPLAEQFETMQLLSHFERTLPRLNTSIYHIVQDWNPNQPNQLNGPSRRCHDVDEDHDDDDDDVALMVDEDLLDYWQEVAMNAERFIEYKQQEQQQRGGQRCSVPCHGES